MKIIISMMIFLEEIDVEDSRARGRSGAVGRLDEMLSMFVDLVIN